MKFLSPLLVLFLVGMLNLSGACSKSKSSSSPTEATPAQSIATGVGIESQDDASIYRFYLKSESEESVALVGSPFQSKLEISNGEMTYELDACSNTETSPILSATLSNKEPYFVKIRSCSDESQEYCAAFIPSLGQFGIADLVHVVIAVQDNEPVDNSQSRVCDIAEKQFAETGAYLSGDQYIAAMIASSQIPSREDGITVGWSAVVNASSTTPNNDSVNAILENLFSRSGLILASNLDYGELISASLRSGEVANIWDSDPINAALTGSGVALNPATKILIATDIWLSKIAALDNSTYNTNLAALVYILNLSDPIATVMGWEPVAANSSTFPWDSLSAVDPCSSGMFLDYISKLGFVCRSSADDNNAQVMNLNSDGSLSAVGSVGDIFQLAELVFSALDPDGLVTTIIGTVCSATAGCIDSAEYEDYVRETLYPSYLDPNYSPSTVTTMVTTTTNNSSSTSSSSSTTSTTMTSTSTVSMSSTTSTTFAVTTSTQTPGGNSPSNPDSGCPSGHGNAGEFCCGNGDNNFCRDGNSCNRRTLTCASSGGGCSISIFCLQ